MSDNVIIKQLINKTKAGQLEWIKAGSDIYPAYIIASTKGSLILRDKIDYDGQYSLEILNDFGTTVGKENLSFLEFQELWTTIVESKSPKVKNEILGSFIQ